MRAVEPRPADRQDSACTAGQSLIFANHLRSPAANRVAVNRESVAPLNLLRAPATLPPSPREGRYGHRRSGRRGAAWRQAGERMSVGALPPVGLLPLSPDGGASRFKGYFRGSKSACAGCAALRSASSMRSFSERSARSASAVHAASERRQRSRTCSSVAASASTRAWSARARKNWRFDPRMTGPAKPIRPVRRSPAGPRLPHRSPPAAHSATRLRP